MTHPPEPPFSLAADNSTPADTRLEADMARLGLIRQARDRGATWTHIGRTLGMTGPEAKRHHAHLTRSTRRTWYLQQTAPPTPPEPPPADPGTEFWTGVAGREGIQLIPAKPRPPRKRKRR